MVQKRFLTVLLLGYSMAVWASETTPEETLGKEGEKETKEAQEKQEKQENEDLRSKAIGKCQIKGKTNGIQMRTCVNKEFKALESPNPR